MGDRGGKKNKEKSQKQMISKHEHEAQQKLAKQHKAPSVLEGAKA